MDLVTQGLLGGVLSQSIAQKQDIRRATFIGVFSGVLADADVLIHASNDPLLSVEFHRHFTHSVFFIPLGALIATLLVWPFFQRSMSYKKVYLYALAGFSLSGFIDACTSYGTHLFWPLVEERLAFHIISIVDPVFTFILLFALFRTYLLKNGQVAHVGLVLCVLYLMMGWLQWQRAYDYASSVAELRGHSIERIVVKPTLGNLVLWRSTYINDGVIYTDGLRVGVFSENRVYEGASVDLFIPKRDAIKALPRSVLYRDILRFQQFSDGFIALHPDNPAVLGDMRYAMLPTSLNPLWGISLHWHEADKHAAYGFYRQQDAGMRQQFWRMLRGVDLQE